jgi:NADH-quinone oxidoreductase subunit C
VIHLSSTETEAPEQAPDEGVAPGDPLRQVLVDVLRDALGEGVVATHLDPGRDVWVRVATDAWRAAGLAARDRLRLTYFCFLSVIDWMPSPYGRSLDSEVDQVVERAVDSAVDGTVGEERGAQGAAAERPEPMTHGYVGGDTRFQVFARVFSPTEKVGLTLVADVPDDTGTVDSWTEFYGGANWHEREAWEMYGVVFTGHPNLRHLYLPGDFEGFPLRKDFPLLARIIKPWPGIVDVEGMPGVADEEGAE